MPIILMLSVEPIGFDFVLDSVGFGTPDHRLTESKPTGAVRDAD